MSVREHLQIIRSEKGLAVPTTQREIVARDRKQKKLEARTARKRRKVLLAPAKHKLMELGERGLRRPETGTVESVMYPIIGTYYNPWFRQRLMFTLHGLGFKNDGEKWMVTANGDLVISGISARSGQPFYEHARLKDVTAGLLENILSARLLAK